MRWLSGIFTVNPCPTLVALDRSCRPLSFPFLHPQKTGLVPRISSSFLPKSRERVELVRLAGSSSSYEVAVKLLFVARSISAELLLFNFLNSFLWQESVVNEPAPRLTFDWTSQRLALLRLYRFTAMAKSKYEYVKEFEVRDEVMLPNLIVVRVDGHDFRIFCAEHKFKRPNDEQALNLMNLCAIKMLKKFPEIVFSYGFSDEYSFIFEKMTKIHSRRASKLLSLIVSLFTSLYVAEWKEFFPDKELKYPPTFRGKVIPCATVEVLQHYLAWRQTECKGFERAPTRNTKMSCYSRGLVSTINRFLRYFGRGLVFSRKRLFIQRTLLAKDFGMSTQVFSRISVMALQRAFQELDVPSLDLLNLKTNYSHQLGLLSGLMVTIFINSHEFEKPNDKQALKLMNVCAVAVLLKIEDVIFAYGQSDEYSFILKKDTRFYQRKSSNVVSVILSLFTATYTMKWKTFFPQKELQYPPSFDGRAVCYPDTKILHDYLAWRQVDCHINNLNNTCFWLLVKSGKSMKEANLALKSTLAKDKCELLAKQYGIVYNTLPPMFRWGSSVFWEDVSTEENRASNEIAQRQVVVKHCDIIQSSFWEANPSILA